MGSISDQKALLRTRVKETLRALDPEAARLSDAAICRQVERLPEYQRAKTVFAFVGVGWEIDTKNLLGRAMAEGKRVAVPRCVGPGIMEACLIRGLDDLAPGAYGIPEPRKGCPICPPNEIDFAVIPCVSCDRACMRLGQGGGFYDRFLAGALFPTAALCRSIALEAVIPAEPWDRPVDCVVAETEVYRRHSA